MSDEKKKIVIWETDQWTSVQVCRQGFTLADLEACGGQVRGGDADAVRVIFGGGHVDRIEVVEDAAPSIGHVWFRATETGALEIYKAAYDSSD